MLFLKSIVRFATYLESFLVVLFGAAITISVFLGVFYRYVLRDPLIWSGELALICFAWLVFLGAGLAAKQNAHMSIDAMTRYFPVGINHILRLATLGLVMILLTILVFFGVKHAVGTHNIRTTALQLPWTYVFLSVPAGALLMLVYTVDDFIDRVARKD